MSDHADGRSVDHSFDTVRQRRQVGACADLGPHPWPGRVEGRGQRLCLDRTPVGNPDIPGTEYDEAERSGQTLTLIGTAE
jgi:hypothetical protein